MLYNCPDQPRLDAVYVRGKPHRTGFPRAYARESLGYIGEEKGRLGMHVE